MSHSQKCDSFPPAKISPIYDAAIGNQLQEKPSMTLFIRSFVVVACLSVVSAFAQAPNPAPSTAGGATGILRAAKTVFV
jgi:hypothetical protein